MLIAAWVTFWTIACSSMRPAPDTVEKARARLRLAATGTLGDTDRQRWRTIARKRRGTEAPGQISEDILLIASDRARQETLFRQAAAMLHARDIAAQIRAEDVAVLEAEIPAELYQYALDNSETAPARAWKEAPQIAQTFAGDIDLCRAVWIGDLPKGVLPIPAAPAIDAPTTKRIREALAATMTAMAEDAPDG